MMCVSSLWVVFWPLVPIFSWVRTHPQDFSEGFDQARPNILSRAATLEAATRHSLSIVPLASFMMIGWQPPLRGDGFFP
jgi:hypothetical protein